MKSLIMLLVIYTEHTRIRIRIRTGTPLLHRIAMGEHLLWVRRGGAKHSIPSCLFKIVRERWIEQGIKGQPDLPSSFPRITRDPASRLLLSLFFLLIQTSFNSELIKFWINLPSYSRMHTFLEWSLVEVIF